MTADNQTFKKYLFHYRYDNANWSFEIKAKDEEDAKARVAQMPWATLDGEMFGRIPIRSSWPARTIVWLFNRFGSAT